ncbi:MAG: Rieske (2Fe-2S) protein [Candidatus Promineifilaceae bacterium]
MPFFKKSKPTPDADGFYPAAKLHDVQVGRMTAVKIGDKVVVLTAWEGDVYAFTAVCPHAAANLTNGEINRWKVTCPDHDYCFDIRNGRILYPADEMMRLKTYPVKVTDDQILVKVN